MASFLTSSEIDSLTGDFVRHFETFSAFNSLIVHKEPLKTILSNTENVLPGYGPSSTEENYELTPVSGVFRAIVLNEKNSAEQTLTELQTRAPSNKIKIKVERDAYDFITNGKTELFELNGLTYNGVDNVYAQNFLGARYYVFELKSVN